MADIQKILNKLSNEDIDFLQDNNSFLSETLKEEIEKWQMEKHKPGPKVQTIDIPFFKDLGSKAYSATESKTKRFSVIIQPSLFDKIKEMCGSYSLSLNEATIIAFRLLLQTLENEEKRKALTETPEK